ncbi:hypothetical protein QJS10_CPB11g00120 [Acorus calamus]|uniref:U3 small nucleolar RNA-associated protein 13 C-terminal domain-containing protein n=1 Tax=Acorus calamus TaxID=4465 RepID=A0AAV9DR87_ACOCL|nr:hypothetical protein QJS10_CPB11g00120 [Acorus calamus]
MASLKKSYRCSKSLQRFYTGGPVAVSSDGTFIACACDDKINIVDSSNASVRATLEGDTEQVTALTLSPDGKLLFSASHSRLIRVWDLSSSKCLRSWKGHEGPVMSMACDASGGCLATGGADRKVFSGSDDAAVRVLDLVSKKCVAVLEKHFSAVTSLAVSENGWTLLSAGRDKVVNVWDLRKYSLKVTVPTHEVLETVHAIHSDMALANFLGTHSSTEGTLKLGLHRRLIGYNEDIVDLKFLGEEEKFVAVATNVEQVQVYDLASMSCSYVLAGHTDIVLCLDTCVTSAGRTLIATGSKDNNVRLWDAEKKCCIGVGIGHMKAVGAVVFSKKGGNFFVSGSRDRTIKVWSLDGLSEDIDHVTQLKAKATVAAHADDKDINSLAISPNDGLVCSGSQDHTACIWRLPELVLVMVLKGHKRGIWSVEFSPVDKCVLTSSGDKTIKIWSIADGSCLKTFEGHTASVLRASFITRGTQLVSCGADGLVKLWTVKSNECIATYDQHEDKIWALAVGKKTEMLATGGSDAMVNLWHDCTAAEKEEAFLKEEEAVLKCQELENAVSDVDYARAIQLAFELHRPHKLFDLFAELYRHEEIF